jgi:murein DD-endopeptidase MepM/ murein hydrolase activator NlpD
VADEKKKKWISIMIVPEDGAGVKKWRLTTRSFLRLKILVGAAIVLMAVGIVSTLGVGVMYVQVKHYQTTNQRLTEAARQMTAIAARLERYREKEKTLRDILGSDIELPPAPESETASADAGNPRSGSSGQTNEIQQAIARKESMMRRRPDIWPVNDGQVIDRFRNTGSAQEIHPGIDIIAPKRSSVMAVADGRVTFAGSDDLLGLLVVIDHENGWETQYGHNDLLLVNAGDTVRKGQAIAIYGGKGGQSTGAHLHFEVLFQGKAVNPLDIIPMNPTLRISER